MNALRIALMQMHACGRDQAANQEKGARFCEEAARMGADIAVFPEMWNTGYETVDPAHAIDADSDYVRGFRALAQSLDMAILLTYLQKWPALPRNAASLIDRHGAILYTYAKVHTCDFSPDEAACSPGDGFHVAALDTRRGPVQAGTMICYDREFPESARVLMLQGAEVILVPNACEMEINRLTQLRARAYENMTAVALANYARWGHSVAYDGMAFNQDESSRDMMVVEAGTAEGIYMATVDLDTLRDYRSRETWGDAFRKPGHYGIIAENDPRPPFVRAESRRG